ncbi:MAG: alpha/beta fold hydrolase [Bryobacteraceae bacterium]
MNSSDFRAGTKRPYARGASKELIVFLHGYGPFAKRHLRAIASAIAGEPIELRTFWEPFIASLKAVGLAGLFAAFLLGGYELWRNHSTMSLILFAIVLLAVIVLGVAVFWLAILVIFYERFSYGGYEEYADDSFGTVVSEIASKRPDADILFPFYNAGLFSNADPFLVASRLDELIVDVCREREKRSAVGSGPAEYERIVLIGHSTGASIVRKAYVYGLGATEDHPVFHETAYTLGGARKKWSGKVERIVLLAPMNRGWAIWPRPRHMTVPAFLFYVLFLATATLTGTARFLRKLRKGSRFVANRRLQWIRLCRQDEIAPVILLLGDTDNMVSQEDHQDVAASDRFIFVPVPSSGHGSIVKFADSDHGETRLARFLDALNSGIEYLQRTYVNDTAEASKPEIRLRSARHAEDLRGSGDVVFVLHGIRDFGHWTEQVRRTIKEQDSSLAVITNSYGYFPIMRFLLFGVRQRKVRMFMDWYTEAIGPGAREVSVLGHSNGTYIVARALRDYEALKFKYVALAGSIVPRAFDWDKYVDGGRVTVVRNDVSSDDCVVALVGRFWEAFSENLGVGFGSFGDIGSSGFHGFMANSAREYETRYYPGGHSGAITIPENLRSLARFLATGDSAVDRAALLNSQSKWISSLSKASPVLGLAAIAALVLIGEGVVEAAHAALQIPGPVALSGYVLVVVAGLCLF